MAKVAQTPARVLNVFVDTSAWYALHVVGDPHHTEACEVERRLREESASLHTHEWIMLEVLQLFARRHGRDAAVAVGRALRTSSALQIHYLDPDLLEASWRRYEAEPSVGPVDAVSFAVMERLGLSRAFSYDNDFVRAGFRLEV